MARWSLSHKSHQIELKWETNQLQALAAQIFYLPVHAAGSH